MRPVLHGDVMAAARVLVALPLSLRPVVMEQLLEQAAAADLFRKRLNRGHPEWGNGSLMGAAMKRNMAPEPFLDDPDYCRCLMLVISTLLVWRSDKAVLSQKRKICNLPR